MCWRCWPRCSAALSTGQGILSSLLSPSVPLLLGSCHRVTVCWVLGQSCSSRIRMSDWYSFELAVQWLVSSAQPPCHILIALVACSQTRPGAADNYCPAHSCRTALLPYTLTTLSAHWCCIRISLSKTHGGNQCLYSRNPSMQFKVYLEHKCEKSTHLLQCKVQTKRLMSHFLPVSRDQVRCTALVTWPGRAPATQGWM